ncbi:MAG: hypothetical protein AUG04_08775 [Deltaproteobacteria bacterium 13_1_20CM_2_69_21]|nr:MAG: hypothetical protein AUG04_08775 [Deltaproteobacteria bacterium 13_1_20CM_2_69_21]
MFTPRKPSPIPSKLVEVCGNKSGATLAWSTGSCSGGAAWTWCGTRPGPCSTSSSSSSAGVAASSVSGAETSLRSACKTCARAGCGAARPVMGTKHSSSAAARRIPVR